MKSILYLFIIIVFALPISIIAQSRLTGRIPGERSMDRISERRNDTNNNETIRRRDRRNPDPVIKKRKTRQKDTKVLERRTYVKEVEQKYVPEVNSIIIKQPSHLAQCVSRPSPLRDNTPSDIKLYNKLIRWFPNDVILYYMRGVAKIKYKYYYGAVQDITVYLTSFPEDGEAYYQRGLAFLFGSDKENAYLDFQSSYYFGYYKSSQILKKYF